MYISKNFFQISNFPHKYIRDKIRENYFFFIFIIHSLLSHEQFKLYKGKLFRSFRHRTLRSKKIGMQQYSR